MTCKDKPNGKIVYTNTHTSILLHKKAKEKFRKSPKSISVLLIGIENMSRLSFIRRLPNTYHYLKKNKWIDMKGYNTMDDSVFQNVMTILTGMNASTTIHACNPNKFGQLDKCNLLFNEYNKLGYTTAFAEDSSHYGIFNRKKNKGFQYPPTDFYLRPYIIISEKLKSKIEPRYCLGLETAGERIMNVALDFVTTFKDSPSFGLFWMSSFSYNNLNMPSRMDIKLLKFLNELKGSGALNRTIVILFSDHGNNRFSYNKKGWKEERLPFLFFFLPERFQINHFTANINLQQNSNKLVSAYNIYMTLQDILIKSNTKASIESALGCLTCMSLFDKLETEISCQDLGITKHWCSCKNLNRLSTKVSLVKEAAFRVIEVIEMKKRKSKQKTIHCAKFELNKVIYADISEKVFTWNNIIIVGLKTIPSAVFEATIELVALNKTYDYVVLNIERLDMIKNCTSDIHLNQFCYCY